MVRSHRVVRRAGSQRQKTWVGPANQSDIAIGSGLSVIMSSFDPAASFMLAPTIIRTRGTLAIWPTAFGVDLDFAGAYGLCIVSNEAFAAGAASVPRPFDDANWGGWIVWQSFGGHLEFSSGVGVNLEQLRYEINSKAMRKIKDNETVVEVCESQTGAFQALGIIRQLYLMS